MKIINNIKKSKMKPFQIFVLLIVILLVISVVKFFSKSEGEQIIKVQVVGKNWVDLHESYDGFRPPYWLTENLSVGMVEKSVDGSNLSEVLMVEKYSRGGPEFDVYLTIRVKGILNKRLEKFVYNGTSIEIGSQIIFHLDNVIVNGQVIDDSVPEEGYEKRMFRVVGRKENLEPWEIDKIKIGDKVTNGTEKIAEIVSLKTEPSLSSIFLTSKDGNSFLQNNWRVKDLILTVDIIAEKHGDNWYYAGHQLVKNGQNIWLYFSNIDLDYVHIQSVEDIK